MKRSAEELLTAVREVVGEDNVEDKVLSLYEDISDSVGSADTDMDKRYKELEEKYNTLDNDWRTRYRERFFNKGKIEERNEFVPSETEDKAEDELYQALKEVGL